MKGFIIAHDVGTSCTKAVLVDVNGNVIDSVSEEYRVYYPRPGWAEQEPEDWWGAVAKTTTLLLEKAAILPRDVLAMTFATQMLGIVPMGGEGALRRAIIWLDSRATREAERLMRRFISAKVFALIAGARLGGKDGMPKLLWLKENEPRIYKGMRCFLDTCGYLLYKTTGRSVMELSNASVFGIDLKRKRWLNWVFKYFGLDTDKLPPLVKSTDRVGELKADAAKACGLLPGTPIIAGAGDAPAAAVGSGTVREGEGHVYLGTSGWVGVTTEKTPTGRCGVAAIQSADPEKAFLFAESETAGYCLRWIRDQFYREEKEDPQIENVYALMDRDVNGVPPGSESLIFTPWMYGERAPISDNYVRSTFFNLCANHRREHLLRAVYEGVAYNIRWILEIVEQRFGFRLPRLRVIGGGARGDVWMQILADVTKREVETLENPQERGAVGAALVAAIGLGVYANFEALAEVIKAGNTFSPDRGNGRVYDFLFENYKALYRQLKGIYRRVNGRQGCESDGVGALRGGRSSSAAEG
ncbi:MAG: FGGY-family carbohydrate kinase [Candidatus Bipolaricaulia bacterium]